MKKKKIWVMEKKIGCGGIAWTYCYLCLMCYYAWTFFFTFGDPKGTEYHNLRSTSWHTRGNLFLNTSFFTFGGPKRTECCTRFPKSFFGKHSSEWILTGVCCILKLIRDALGWYPMVNRGYPSVRPLFVVLQNWFQAHFIGIFGLIQSS